LTPNVPRYTDAWPLQDVESLLISLLLQDYLKEEYSSTAYTINVYLTPGPQSLRLTRLSEEDVRNGNGPRIRMSFLKKEKGRKSITAKTKKAIKPSDFFPPTRKARVSVLASSDDSDASDPGIRDWDLRQSSRGTGVAVQANATMTPGLRGSSRAPKRKRVDTSEEEASVDDHHELADFIVDDDDDRDAPRESHGAGSTTNSDDEDGDNWAFSFVHSPVRRSKPVPKRQSTSMNRQSGTLDIIELSD